MTKNMHVVGHVISLELNADAIEEHVIVSHVGSCVFLDTGQEQGCPDFQKQKLRNRRGDDEDAMLIYLQTRKYYGQS